jgi:hypothetical protein
MANNNLLGSQVPLEIDFTGAGTTYKTLVCLESFECDLSTKVDQQETDCGVISAVGTPVMTINFDCVMELEPITGQASFAECDAALIAKTKVAVRVQNPVSGAVALGAKLYRQASAYFTNVKVSKSTDKTINFSGQLVSTGTIDITV